MLDCNQFSNRSFQSAIFVRTRHLSLSITGLVIGNVSADDCLDCSTFGFHAKAAG